MSAWFCPSDYLPAVWSHFDSTGWVSSVTISCLRSVTKWMSGLAMSMDLTKQLNLGSMANHRPNCKSNRPHKSKPVCGPANHIEKDCHLFKWSLQKPGKTAEPWEATCSLPLGCFGLSFAIPLNFKITVEDSLKKTVASRRGGFPRKGLLCHILAGRSTALVSRKGRSAGKISWRFLERRSSSPFFLLATGSHHQQKEKGRDYLLGSEFTPSV